VPHLFSTVRLRSGLYTLFTSCRPCLRVACKLPWPAAHGSQQVGAARVGLRTHDHACLCISCSAFCPAGPEPFHALHMAVMDAHGCYVPPLPCLALLVSAAMAGTAMQQLQSQPVSSSTIVPAASTRQSLARSISLLLLHDARDPAAPRTLRTLASLLCPHSTAPTGGRAAAEGLLLLRMEPWAGEGVPAAQGAKLVCRPEARQSHCLSAHKAALRCVCLQVVGSRLTLASCGILILEDGLRLGKGLQTLDDLLAHQPTHSTPQACTCLHTCVPTA
jgi:hypothetical protein